MEIHTTDKLHMPDRRQLLILIPFAFFYTAAAMLGDLEKAAALSVLQNLGRAFLWLVGSYAVLLGLCFALANRTAIASGLPLLSRIPAEKTRSGNWYIWLLFTTVCLIGYLPYYLMYYPTWLSNDAVWQIEQVLGWVNGSNHHPYFHTLILKFFFTIGYRLSGTYTGAAAFYTFWQVLMMAMVFAFFVYQLYKRGTRTIWLILALAFYAALPINGMLTICMGKDEFFTAALLLFAWMTAEFDLDEEAAQGTELEREESESKKGQGREKKQAAGKGSLFRWLAYFWVGLLVCLLRSNGIFIFLGTAFFAVISRIRPTEPSVRTFTFRGNAFFLTGRRKFPVRTFGCVAAVLVCYLIWHGPVLRALRVEPPDTIEGLTMPTQHILCAYLKGGELTEEEIEMIDRVVPVEEVGDYYNPWLFDIVKEFIRSEGNQQVIADNKWEYFMLWLRAGLRNPLQYMVAEVRQTAGYWAYSVKDYEYVYGEYYMVDNPFGITTQRKFFSYDDELAMHDFLMGFLELYNRVWSLGLNTWLMVFGIAYVVYNRGNVMIYVPFIMLLATLLLATPVYNEFRYAYGLFAAFPILFSYSFRVLSRNGETDEKVV